MRSLATVVFILVAGWQTLPAQEEVSDPEEMFDFGIDFFLSEEYEEAVYYFRQLVDLYPDNANFNWKVGETYLKIPGQEQKAIPYLKKAVENTTLKYKPRSFDEKKAPYHALFYLGNAYRINNELEEALNTYEEFMDLKDFGDNYNVSMVEDEVARCQRAYIIKDVPLNIRKTKLSAPINTGGNDFNPVVSADGSTLVYVTSLTFFDAIELSKKEDGGWGDPEVLNPQVQSDGNHYPTSINRDGTELFMVEKNTGNEDIFVSRLDGPFWSKAKRLGKNINTGGRESHACISADGKTLYFTSDRSGGFGGLDIYSSQRKEDGTWGPATNLGPVINTQFNEDTPFITKDNTRLYFSSDGHFSMGGYDIFYSDLVDGKWRDPVNRGYPINTTGDDLFYFPLTKNDRALYSMIDREGAGTSDIYEVDILPRGASPKKPREKEMLFSKDFSLLLIDQANGDTLVIRFDSLEQQFQLLQKGSKYKIKVLE